MFYYSQAISEFTKKLYRLASGILLSEMGIKVLRSRFEYNGYRYPLNFITFEKEKTLGFFDPHYLQIGIHRHFLFTQDEELLLNVLRHELVHYITYIEYGHNIKPHGIEFQHFCQRFGYSDDISSATYDNYSGTIIMGENHPKKDLLEKVKKLFKLSESPNTHEAKLALEKANQLLKKHSLNSPDLDEEIEYQIVVLKTGKRVNSKYQAIAEILHQFMVKVIFNHSQVGGFRLEAFGRSEHIEFSEYVFHFLDQKIEYLWLQAKKDHGLKGTREKNSFIWGLAEGFIQTLKKQSSADITKFESKELVKLENEVTEAFHSFYKTRRSSQVSSKIDRNSQNIGLLEGAKLNIRSPINKAKTFFLG